ncbi:hypothetical protein [Candidatus Marithrix sp. Canyon 246]|uniref:hypothetical protein n=1 Tax=Candidatus Marithrix sp. Canyon 246 TaxID=1827136 RepID=UPI00084A0A23|nr:hypothetical protein [Candidatus Marithrix sp. Canyon 246]
MSIYSVKLIFIILLLSILELGLASAVLFMPDAPTINLTEVMHEQLATTNMTNSLSAIIVHFRSYDILLSISCLFIAIVGIWTIFYSTPIIEKTEYDYDTPLMQDFPRLILLVIFVVTIAYILWRGAELAIIAFHIGAVLAGIALFIRLKQATKPQIKNCIFVRLVLSSGLLVFATIAFSVTAAGYEFSNSLILLTELSIIILIAFSLLIFFMARPNMNN